MSVGNGRQPGAICMGISPCMSARYRGGGEKELGFAMPAVSDGAGWEREQHVGRSPPKEPGQKGNETQALQFDVGLGLSNASPRLSPCQVAPSLDTYSFPRVFPFHLGSSDQKQSRQIRKPALLWPVFMPGRSYYHANLMQPSCESIVTPWGLQWCH